MANIAEHNFIYDLLHGTAAEDLNYIYRGEFNPDITNYILSLAEKNIVESKIKGRTKKRVFHIMVESIQNITRHQDFSDENLAQTAFFAIQKSGPIFYITTGNIINKEEIEPLKVKLENLNSLSKNELTQTYLEVLNDGQISSKGGAGLGLIEIVRKSGNKLSYDFKNMSTDKAFIYMHSFINTAPEEEMKKPKTIFTFDYLKKLHQQIISENVLLIYCNLFEQDSLVRLISVLKSQKYSALAFKKRVISSMVELLQNIIQHGKMKVDEEFLSPGIFYITKEKDAFFLKTINYIKSSEILDLENKFISLNKMGEEELEELYNKQLFDFSFDESNAGLGFIELRMKSKNPIGYSFVEVNNTQSLLNITITLKEKID